MLLPNKEQPAWSRIICINEGDEIWILLPSPARKQRLKAWVLNLEILICSQKYSILHYLKEHIQNVMF